MVKNARMLIWTKLLKAFLAAAAAMSFSHIFAQAPPIFPPDLDSNMLEEQEVNSSASPTNSLLSPAEEKETTRRLLLEHVDSIFMQGDSVLLDGHVLFRWGEYTLKADRAKGNTKTRQYTLSGHVGLTGAGQTSKGDELFIDFKTQSWSFKNGVAIISPQLLRGNLLAELYAVGEKIDGYPGHIKVYNGSATTCEYPAPHYALDAKFIDFEQDRRLLLKQVGIDILGHRIITLPYVVIPLQGSRYRGILPDIGQSQDEGFYIKAALGYALNKGDDGNLRIDLMQKKGVGLGVDNEYKFLKAVGTFSLYFLANQAANSKDLNFNLQHRQKFGSVNTEFRTDYHKNSYLLFPDNTTSNSNFTATLPSKNGGETRFNARLSDNKASGFDSANSSYSLTDMRQLSRNFHWNIDLSLQSSASTSSFSISKRKEADVNAVFSLTQKPFDADLNIQSYTPIGSSEGFYAGLERLPELALRSSSSRLFGENNFFRNSPLSLGMTFGEYAEQSGTTQEERLAFDVNTSHYSRSERGLQFNYNSGFKQALYSDGTAQYSLQNDNELKYLMGRRTALALRYNYMRPYGYTPFFFDRYGSINTLSGSFDVEFSRSLTLQAQTGYDLLATDRGQDPFQPASLNAIWTPEKWFRFRTAAQFDPNTNKFTNIQSDLVYLAGATRVDIAARYDPLRHTLADANLRVDAFKWGRLRTQALLLYDGYLKAFTSRQYVFTYDLHCVEALASYIDNPFGFRTERDFRFMIRIKALPFQSRFGFGQRGESLQPSTFGDRY